MKPISLVHNISGSLTREKNTEKEEEKVRAWRGVAWRGPNMVGALPGSGPAKDTI